MRPAAGIRRAARLLALHLAWLVVVAQVRAAKSPRSNNTQRDDLFRKEEVIGITAGGHIQSPRYPNPYPRNLLLSWKLLAPPFARVLLEFDRKFGLEDPENNVCRYDFVEVEDVAASRTITWGRWCGRKPPSPIASKNNQIRITFKSDDFFVAKPGFRIQYSVMINTPLSFVNILDTIAVSEDTPLSADALDDVIAEFSTVEEIFQDLNPTTWRQDLNSIYIQKNHYRPRSYSSDRLNKIDLDSLNEDVKKYSCTPRNFSVNLREELRVTNAVFFPRCLLVKRCSGNCGCGTNNWNSCTCSAAKTVSKLHEVMKFTPGRNFVRKKTRAQWALEEIQLHHHEKCACVCNSQVPR